MGMGLGGGAAQAEAAAALLSAKPPTVALSRARKWLTAYDKPAQVALAALQPAAVAWVLLEGLQELEDPLLTSKLYDAFAAAVSTSPRTASA